MLTAKNLERALCPSKTRS